MITITMNKIRAHSPLESGLEKLLEAKGLDFDPDTEFPLSDVLDSNGLDDTIWCLRCLPDHEKLRRAYARWVALDVIHLWDAPPVVYQYLETGDESLSEAAMSAARAARAMSAARAARAASEDAARAASAAARADAAWAAARARNAMIIMGATANAAMSAQETKLRELLGGAL